MVTDARGEVKLPLERGQTQAKKSGAPEVEILYGIAPAHWGQGLATEAARALLRYGFEEHGFDRILAGADPPNVTSFRVMEKAGMTFAQRVRVNDVDAVYYAVAREAFQPDDALYRVRRA